MAGEDGEKPPIDLGAFEQIFQDFFGKTGGKRGGDLKQPLRISPTEARTGGSREVRITRRVVCQPCAGSGARDGILRDCPGCRGSGSEQQTAGQFLIQTVCPICRGARKVAESPCGACERGLRPSEESLRVTLPPDVKSGQMLRLRGKGDELAGAPPGDLYLELEVTTVGVLERRDDDLVFEAQVGARHVLFGGSLVVPTLDGETTIRVPRGVRDGDTLTLPGRGETRSGSPYRGDGKKRGDQIVIFRVPPGAAKARARLTVAAVVGSAVAASLWWMF